MQDKLRFSGNRASRMLKAAVLILAGVIATAVVVPLWVVLRAALATALAALYTVQVVWLIIADNWTD